MILHKKRGGRASAMSDLEVLLAKVSGEKLGKALGVSRMTVSRWSRGDNIPPIFKEVLRVLASMDSPQEFITNHYKAIIERCPESLGDEELKIIREGGMVTAILVLGSRNLKGHQK